MIVDKDPFGKAILDYLDGVRDAHIRVDSNITEDESIPVNYLFRSFDQMPEKEQRALSMAKGRILDAGAGSGAHSLVLQQQNKNVVALDYSFSCCKAMQKQGLKEVLHQDFFLLDETQKFDTLLFMMNGLGMPGKVERLETFFIKCKSLLNPGGIIVGESTDILYMFEEEDGSVELDLNGEYYGEMEYKMTYNSIEGEWFSWLYVASDLVIEAAEKVGFKVIDFYEGEESDYMVAFELV